MAVEVLTDALITINAIVLSTRSNQVELDFTIEAKESTAFGDTGRKYVGGLQNNKCTIALMQDYAAANVEATVYPLVGTSTTLIIRKSSAVVGVTNPTYTLSNTFLESHTPVKGDVGELMTIQLVFSGGTLVKTTV